MVARDVTTASIWFHTRSSKANIAGLTILKNNISDIQKLVGNHSLTWREQETSSLDVSVEGIGWGSNNTTARKELLGILAALTAIARKYTPELREAISSVE